MRLRKRVSTVVATALMLNAVSGIFGSIAVAGTRSADLSAPNVPSSVTSGQLIGITGTIDKAAATGPIRLLFYQKIRGTWVLQKTEYAKWSGWTSTTTKYVLDTRIPYAGEWRIGASYGGNAVYASGYKYRDFRADPRDFEITLAMRHVHVLAGIGPRVAGSSQELRGLHYTMDQLRSWGYGVSLQAVPISGGRTSHNVIAERTGSSDKVLVIGAHVDTVSGSPGANDNASGVGVVLEMARVFALRQPHATLRFIIFGAEEISGPSSNDHHYGSRYYVRNLKSSERQKIAGMLNLDMVGHGSSFHVRSMRRGPQELVAHVEREASRQGVRISFLVDSGATGWSDHEPFELAGIPAAWLQWRPDPAYHKPSDVALRLSSACMSTTGRFVQELIRTTNEPVLAELSSVSMVSDFGGDLAVSPALRNEVAQILQ